VLVPKASDVEHGFFDCRVAPVQVRLADSKVVVIVLPGLGIELPSRTTEAGDPIIRRNSRSLAITPDVPVAMRRSAR